jgi:type I restriction enzyme, S subunit
MNTNSEYLRLGLLVSLHKGRATASQVLSSKEPEKLLPLLSMNYLRGSSDVININPSKNDIFASEGDILVLWDGSNAGEFLKARKGILSSTLAKITVHYPINEEFLFYVLKAMQPYVQSECIGMGIPHVNGNFLKALKIPIPDKQTQIDIANFLDKETTRIDLLIENKFKLIELLKEKLQSKTTSLVTKGLDYSQKQAPTNIEWLPEAPSHWRVRRIASIYRESLEMGDDRFPVLSVSIHSGISDYELEDEDRHRIVNHIEDKTFYKRVRPGDLVYNMMRAWQGAFGVAVVDGLVSPAYVVCRSNEKIHSPYFESLLRTPMCIEDFRRASKGIADFRQRLYWDHFRQVRVILPPLKEQIDITEKIQIFFAAINNAIEPIKISINHLTEFRSSLIHSAVTRQLDIKKWKNKGATDYCLDKIDEDRKL